MITTFHFSSFEHPGCRVYCGLLPPIDDIVVDATREDIVIHEVGSTTNNSFTEKGATSIHGKLYAGAKIEWGMNGAPFDVHVRAYNAVENVDYVLKLLHCWIVDDRDGSFIATTLIPWVPMTKPNEETTWHDMHVKLKSGPNQNGDDFHDVGRVENWKQENQPVVHVDKTVPPRTYVLDPKPKNGEVKMSIACGCAQCGAENSVNVITGRCQRCGYVLLAARAQDARNYVSVGVDVKYPVCSTCGARHGGTVCFASAAQKQGAPTKQKPNRKQVDQLQPGMWFEDQRGNIAVAGGADFREATGGVGFVIVDRDDMGRIWRQVSPDQEVTVLPNLFVEMERWFHLVYQWGYDDSPEAWPEIIGKGLERLTRFEDRVRHLLNMYYVDDQKVLARLGELVNNERAAEYAARITVPNHPVGDKVNVRDGVTVPPTEAKLNGVYCVSDDTAHVGPWTTVRACLDCGVLVSGGPTRCSYCVDKITAAEKQAVSNAEIIEALKRRVHEAESWIELDHGEVPKDFEERFSPDSPGTIGVSLPLGAG